MMETMAEQRCLNCNALDADPYDLTIRSSVHNDVYLCDDCHRAIQQEMDDTI